MKDCYSPELFKRNLWILSRDPSRSSIALLIAFKPSNRVFSLPSPSRNLERSCYLSTMVYWYSFSAQTSATSFESYFLKSRHVRSFASFCYSSTRTVSCAFLTTAEARLTRARRTIIFKWVLMRICCFSLDYFVIDPLLENQQHLELIYSRISAFFSQKRLTKRNKRSKIRSEIS